jgi:hypothetical protein
MTDLVVFVPSLKRALAIPGTFDDVFPDTSDDDLEATLGDGYAMAQLYGFFDNGELDPSTFMVDPDITHSEGMLVVLFASIEIIKNSIRSLRTKVAYRAGPVEYAAEQSASALTELLKQLEAQRQELLNLGGAGETFGYVNSWWVPPGCELVEC